MPSVISRKTSKPLIEDDEKRSSEQVGKLCLRLVHSKPIHTHNVPSPFSKESSEQNYRGFLNLALLLLFVTMARLVVENFKKYGFLLSIPGRDVPFSDILYGLAALSTLWTNILIAYGLEWLVFKLPSLSYGKFYIATITINVSGLLLIPSWIVWNRMYHPLLGSFALSITLVLCMKIISYHVVNRELWLLKANNEPSPYPCSYPDNITITNLLYFWIAPTLCYQPSYPKIQKIRVKFLLKRIIELAACLAAIHILTEQYAIPTVQNSLKPIDELDWSGMLERLLKLSISSLYIWILGFYALFHSFLNAFAEVVKFGDRTFYRSWWNARSIDEYWRLWNAPVHQWLKRHIFTPLVSRGWSTKNAQFLIFLLSAAAHEYLVAIPTNIVQGWAFIGMLLQIPLISFTNWYMKNHPESSFGNYFFWITFCILGQPMCILLYYRAWATKKASAILFFFQI